MKKLYSLKDRKGLHPDNFGDPERLLFPILSQDDVDKAAGRIRRVKNRKELKDRIVSIARQKGYTVSTELLTAESDAIAPTNIAGHSMFASSDDTGSFSSLQPEERAELADEDFGDPARKLFPIIEAEDVHRALRVIHLLPRSEGIMDRIKEIAARKGFI